MVSGQINTVPQNTERKGYTLAPIQVAYKIRNPNALELGVSAYEEGGRLGHVQVASTN